MPHSSNIHMLPSDWNAQSLHELFQRMCRKSRQPTNVWCSYWCPVVQNNHPTTTHRLNLKLLLPGSRKRVRLSSLLAMKLELRSCFHMMVSGSSDSLGEPLFHDNWAYVTIGAPQKNHACPGKHNECPLTSGVVFARVPTRRGSGEARLFFFRATKRIYVYGYEFSWLEPPEKWLVDINLHPTHVHKRVPDKKIMAISFSDASVLQVFESWLQESLSFCAQDLQSVSAQAVCASFSSQVGPRKFSKQVSLADLSARASLCKCCASFFVEPSLCKLPLTTTFCTHSLRCMRPASS